MLTMPLLNIRNKLCKAATKLSLARNVEERHELWPGVPKYETTSLKLQSLLDVSNVIFRKTP